MLRSYTATKVDGATQIKYARRVFFSMFSLLLIRMIWNVLWPLRYILCDAQKQRRDYIRFNRDFRRVIIKGLLMV